MRTVYATQFSIEPDSSDCLNKLLEQCKQWVSRYYQDNKIPFDYPAINSKVMPTNNDVVSHDCYTVDDNLLLHHIYWVHPDQTATSIEWHTDLKIASCGTSIEVGFTSKLASKDFSLQPQRYELGRPRIIRAIIGSFKCKRNNEVLIPTPRSISAPDIDCFVNFLGDVNRKTPIILLSRQQADPYFAANPDHIADALASIAHVYILSDKWAGFALTDRVGKIYSCFNGAIRLYWPGFNTNNNPLGYPYWLAAIINEHRIKGNNFSLYLLRRIASVASLQYVDGKVATSILAQVRNRKDQEILKLREIVHKKDVDNKDVNKLFDELIKDNDSLKSEIENKTERIEELQRELSIANNNIRDISESIGANEADTNISPSASSAEDGEEYSDVISAVNKAASQFSDTIIFLDKAKVSAKNSPYKNPERVYEALDAIHDVCADWIAGKLTNTWYAAFKMKGFDYKDKISPTTRGDYGEEYYFIYNGKKLLFEEHITEGKKQPDKCFSIHLYRDKDKKKVVIGHVGRHLSNQST